MVQLATTMSQDGWAGLEFGVGIPCTVGGAVATNAGAFGQVSVQWVSTTSPATSGGCTAAAGQARQYWALMTCFQADCPCPAALPLQLLLRDGLMVVAATCTRGRCAQGSRRLCACGGGGGGEQLLSPFTAQVLVIRISMVCHCCTWFAL